MKILQVHDCSNVGNEIAIGLAKRGHTIQFVDSSNMVDLIFKIDKSNFDIIHAHYLKAPALACYLSRKRPYVISVHGDDYRWGPNSLYKYTTKKAARIFYHISEFDGKIPNSVYIPRPVDTERFTPIENSFPIKRAVFFKVVTADPRLRKGESKFIEEIQKLCKENNIILTIVEKKGISDMRWFLSNFQLIFDIRNCPDASKTGLEAMSMKLNVICAKQPVNLKLLTPELLEERRVLILKEHSINHVAELVEKEYMKILE